MEWSSGFGIHPAAVKIVFLLGVVGGAHNARSPANKWEIDWTTMMVVQATYMDVVMISFMIPPN
jgi:hypothetical protein